MKYTPAVSVYGLVLQVSSGTSVILCFGILNKPDYISERNVSAFYSNITIISNQSVSNQNFFGSINKGIDLTNPNYQSGHTVFKNTRVEGFNLGVDLPAFLQPEDPKLGKLPAKVTFFDNSYLHNYVNLREHSPIMAAKYIYAIERCGICSKRRTCK
ncbi:hypothetical protein SAMN05216302_105911 [Nitrosomonas aestuarii]|uniref:Uncharacterized protein n=2 Tax=Nitrosomonas aestuarii TaxID=52441 RepID=A0A1I4GND2_9PROT|nr:hypothetical protein SAMN05216302_105911 [Nitrosomonas aestuarii]